MTENKKKILAFGEVMLRVAMAQNRTIEQTNEARLNFTGTGLNVLSGIAHFGYETSLLTQLPDNRVGDAAKADVRRLGVSDRFIKQGGNHIGLYFLEQGYGNRPSEVTYLDRAHSSFCLSTWTEEELRVAVQSIDLVHICGISLILTPETRNAALALAKLAFESGKEVCFDFNYRPSLAYESDLKLIRNDYEEMLRYATIVLGSNRDLIELLELETKYKESNYGLIVQKFLADNKIKLFAGTNKKIETTTRFVQGFVYTESDYALSPFYPVYTLDRIGTGDAYAAGIIAKYLEKSSLQDLVNFATGSSVLAHTTQGDSPILSKRHIDQFLENPNLDIMR